MERRDSGASGATRSLAALVLLAALATAAEGWTVAVQAQGFSATEQAKDVAKFEELGLRNRIAAGDLHEDQGWRPWAYGMVLRLYLNSEGPQPPEFAAAEALRAIREAPAHPEDPPLDATDLSVFSWGLDLRTRERFSDFVLELPSEDKSYRPALRVYTAATDRALQKISSAKRGLDRAAAELEAWADELELPPPVVLAHTLLAIERVRLAIDCGVPELGAPFVREAQEWGEVYFDLTDELWYWVQALEVELELALATDDPRRAGLVVERARAHGAWSGQPRAVRDPIELRGLVAVAEVRHAEALDNEEGAEALRALLGEGALTAEDRFTAHFWHAVALLDLGRFEAVDRVLHEIEAEGLATASSRVGPGLAALELRRLRLEGTGRDSSRARELATTAFESLLARARSGLGRPGGRAILHYREDAWILEERLEQQLAEGGPMAALDNLCALHAVGSLALALGAPQLTGAEVQERLVPEGGGLLVLVPGWDRDRLVLVDRAEVTLHDAGSSLRGKRLQQALLRALLLDPLRPVDDPPLVIAARELGEHLLSEAVREHLRSWNALTVVGTDGADYVPFELLVDDGERLGDRLPISYLPSIAVGAVLAERELRPLERVLVAVATDPRTAASASPQGLDTLPFGDRERGRLVAGLAGRELSWLQGEALSRETLIDALRGNDGAHLLLHGALQPGSLSTWGLLLPESAELLLPDDLRSMRLPDTIFVQACSSWRGPQRRGDDGRGHLAGAMIEAGVRLLVVSSVPIGYQASLEAGEVFWKEQRAVGSSAAIAMQSARGGGALTPYLMHVVGDGHRRAPIGERAGTRAEAEGGEGISWIPWSLALLALAAIAIIGRRRR